MEVERIQDGPLKNTEITRFLEASKTSYKAVGNIMTEKKVSMFQQRTLMEIASETEVRNTISKSEPANETPANDGIELESEEEILAKKAEAERKKVEEEGAELRASAVRAPHTQKASRRIVTQTKGEAWAHTKGENWRLDRVCSQSAKGGRER